MWNIHSVDTFIRLLTATGWRKFPPFTRRLWFSARPAIYLHGSTKVLPVSLSPDARSVSFLGCLVLPHNTLQLSKGSISLKYSGSGCKTQIKKIVIDLTYMYVFNFWILRLMFWHPCFDMWYLFQGYFKIWAQFIYEIRAHSQLSTIIGTQNRSFLWNQNINRPSS